MRKTIRVFWNGILVFVAVTLLIVFGIGMILGWRGLTDEQMERLEEIAKEAQKAVEPVKNEEVEN